MGRPKTGGRDALFVTFAQRPATRSAALNADERLWLDLEDAGLEWRAYTGGPRIPRWRLRLNSHYVSERDKGLAARPPLPRG